MLVSGRMAIAVGRVLGDFLSTTRPAWNFLSITHNYLNVKRGPRNFFYIRLPLLLRSFPESLP